MKPWEGITHYLSRLGWLKQNEMEKGEVVVEGWEGQTDREIDLSDPRQRKWYIQQVLSYGGAEDVAQLDWKEIRFILPELQLPQEVRRLWEDYFEYSER